MANPNDRHRVYLSFQDRHGWQCRFLEADLKTLVPKRLHCTSPDKIIELSLLQNSPTRRWKWGFSPSVPHFDR
jgi:hypothetical protein